jgi:hypothetical protein
VIPYLLHLLRRILGRSRPTPDPGMPSTLMDRRLWALGYHPDDQETVVRVRRLEHTLRQCLHSLGALPVDTSATGRQMHSLRVHMMEFLDARNGPLARVIRVWPGLSLEEAGIREQVLVEGERLCIQGKEMLERWEVLEESKQRLALLQSRFQPAMPATWAPYAGAAGLEAQLKSAYSLGRIRAVAEAIEVADQHLTAHLVELENLERDLSRRLRGPDEEQVDLLSESLEERVRGLIDRAIRRVEERGGPMSLALEDLCARHLDHAGYRPGSLRLRGMRNGSVRRSRVWCEHLRIARKRFRR